MRNIKETKKSSKQIWEVLVPYLGTIVFLCGILGLVSAEWLENNYPNFADVLRDLGMSFIPAGRVALIFEWLLRKHYAEGMADIVIKAFSNVSEYLSDNIIEKVVDRVLLQKKTVDIDKLRMLERMQKLGMSRLMTRAELETSDIAFRNAIEILAASQGDKEFFIFGKTLEFVSRQINALVAGLQGDVNFRLSLVDPTTHPWDPSYIRSYKEKSRNSIEKLREVLDICDPNWLGTLELRMTDHLVQNSFSSFVRGNDRVSVLDFDLGDDLSLQCSQEYVHHVNEKNFAYHLYIINKDRWEDSQFVLSFPQKYNLAYVYGVKNRRILFIRKQGKSGWELPGGNINEHEIPRETARREFLEETGYEIDIIQSIETKEENKIAFIGKIKSKIGDMDKIEIEEVKFFSFDHIPNKSSLAYPDSGYNGVISNIDKYL